MPEVPGSPVRMTALPPALASMLRGVLLAEARLGLVDAGSGKGSLVASGSWGPDPAATASTAVMRG
jgi:hypothetical protein